MAKRGKKVKVTKEQRRTQILKVACNVFARKGYRRTDVQEIADRLKIGKGTIYRYFPTKEELFLSGVDATMHKLADSVIQAISRIKDPVKCITAIIEILLDFCNRNRAFIEMVVTERAEFKDRMDASFRALERMRSKRIREVIIEGQRQGLFRKIDPTAISVFLVTLLSGVFITSIPPTDASIKREGKSLADICLHGILARKATGKRAK
jgi:AcrR family transcriptional regulator